MPTWGLVLACHVPHSAFVYNVPGSDGSGGQLCRQKSTSKPWVSRHSTQFCWVLSMLQICKCIQSRNLAGLIEMPSDALCEVCTCRQIGIQQTGCWDLKSLVTSQQGATPKPNEKPRMDILSGQNLDQSSCRTVRSLPERLIDN